MGQSNTKKRRCIDRTITMLVQDTPNGLTPGDVATLRLGLEKMSTEANQVLVDLIFHLRSRSRNQWGVDLDE